MKAWVILAVFLALAGGAYAGGRRQASDDLMLAPLSGDGPRLRLRDFAGAARVVLFWRSDCAPCLVELRELDAFERAAGADAVILVAVESAHDARAALRRLGVSDARAYVAQANPVTALEAVSDGGRRLPFALALDRNGEICRTHVGLLGTARAAHWMAQCSR